MSNMKSKIIDQAKKLGVDLVGFSSMERFVDTPSNQDPLKIFPQAKSVIGLGFRILRGSTRGVEEGSTYYQYTTMAIENIEENVIPITLLRMAAFIEDMGYEAVVQRQHKTIMAEENDTNPEILHDQIFRGNKKEVQMDFKKAAIACGFGEIGLSGQVLTPFYGPYQCFCYIITNAEIKEDPLFEKNLCDSCGACIAACPGNAYLNEKEIITICDKEYEVNKRNNWQCAVYYKGANQSKNPFMPPDAYKNIPEREAIMKGEFDFTPELAKKVLKETDFYPSCRHSLVSSICARACDRACYIHLEKENKLYKKFANDFRKREEWELLSK